MSRFLRNLIDIVPKFLNAYRYSCKVKDFLASQSRAGKPGPISSNFGKSQSSGTGWLRTAPILPLFEEVFVICSVGLTGYCLKDPRVTTQAHG
jgi:hypothetical protein